MSDEIDKVLSEPILPEPSETERKIKNNLIIFSIVAIFMCYWELSISSDSSFLGLKFSGLNQHKIYVALCLFIIYAGFHYLWYVHDFFVEWRLRCTAISELRPLRYGGSFSNSDLKNKRNNTLFHWWSYTKRYISDRDKLNEALINSIGALESKLTQDELSSVSNAPLITGLSQTLEKLKTSHDEVVELNRVLKLPAFEIALPRFNNSFSYFLKSQNIRWIIFECFIPFGLAIVACFFLCLKIFANSAS